MCIAVGTRVLGPYLAGVFGDGETAPRATGCSSGSSGRSTGCAASTPSREQRWSIYAYSLLAFSGVSVLVLYVLQRLQGSLPFNPTDVGAVPEALSFNTAVSFVTNTNWQNYAGETTMSHLTQMAGLAVQNFVSAAVGLCVAVALIRGLARRRSATIGNFWVDLVRGTVRVLLPLARRRRRRAREPGRHPEPARLHAVATTARGRHPVDPRRAVRQPGGDQGARHQRRRPAQRQLRAPASRTPTGSPTCCRSARILLIPFALTYAYGRMVKDQKQGWVVFAAMFAALGRLGGRSPPASRSAATERSTTWA